MEKVPLYNDSDIGYMDEEFLELEVLNSSDQKQPENKSENEEEYKKI